MANSAPPTVPDVPGDWHLREARELAQAHDVDLAHGLRAHQIDARALAYGANALVSGTRRSLLTLLLSQFGDFMVLLLLVAAVISGVIGDLVDTLVILTIVALNAGIGVLQAWRADQALAALQKMAPSQATVLRCGNIGQVAAEALVPGDIVLLEAGNKVPADLRLFDSATLRVDESALTGESVTVDKHARTLAGPSHALGDRHNMAFKGTTATHGRGRGLVVATGMATELGKIAGMLNQDSDRSTPLQLRLAAFGRRVALLVLCICLVIFGVGVMRGEPPMLMVLTAVSLAVAAIPEALPAVVTVLLALGARKMAAMHALIRRLPSVETLGSVSYICSDKTGTLTQNHMRAEALIAGNANAPAWAPGGAVVNLAIDELLRAAALCNDASRTAEGHWKGDPTETALSDAASAAGLDKSALEATCPRVWELPFDSLRKRMTTFHRSAQGLISYTKGAPESLIEVCRAEWNPTVASGEAGLDRQAWLARADALAAQGLRVLAVARRSHAQLPETGTDSATLESGLLLLGLVGLMDPPREEAAQAVRDCGEGGITPVMITGDHPSTARAIALRIGIVDDAQAIVLTGAELAMLDQGALMAQARQVRVYARVDPAQKIRIVEALQAHGEFVAMTGDGVNDAPALKRADIGIAMGRNGTDVAREAASLVLLDDNFATIVVAVREGRRIYDNIRKFVRYAMTGNSGEVWTIFLAPLLLLPIPLLPIHILWVNLVTDGLPGLALAAEPAERGIMQRPPRPPRENLFAHGMWQHILGVGLLLGALCLGVQAWAIAHGHPQWQTMVFTVLTLGQMAHLMAIRSEREPLWRLGLASNRPLLGAVLLTISLQMAIIYVPALQPIFKTGALNVLELGICVGTALVVYIVVEIEKAWRRAFDQRAKP